MYRPAVRCFVVCSLALCLLTQYATGATPEEATRALIGRVLPEHAGQFVLESIPAENGQDVFEIETRDGKVVIRGNNGVSRAMGLNWYLKHY